MATMRLMYKRADRLGELIQAEIADILLRKIKDPRVSMVTITRVHVSSDLRTTKIYFSVLGDQGQRQQAVAGLTSATGFIKRLLGSRLELRYVPEIEFAYDQSLEYGERIDRLFRRMEEKENDRS